MTRVNATIRVATLALALGSLLVACGSDSPDASARPMVTAGEPGGHARESLRNPYTGNADAIAAGGQLFVVKACSGCHGAAGAGGMCPSLVNDTWVYGSDDATLFDLIRLGSAGLRAQGRVRVGREPQAGDMPPLAGAVSDDEAWKLIAYIRSKYAGDPALRSW